MHKNKTHEDVAVTKFLWKQGVFRSRHSYVSTRIHPGTEQQCRYLAGIDCESWRTQIIELSGGYCARCQKQFDKAVLEADHILHKTKMERCWCIRNGQALCRTCHRGRNGKHPQIRWTRKQEAQEQFRKLYSEEK